MDACFLIAFGLVLDLKVAWAPSSWVAGSFGFSVGAVGFEVANRLWLCPQGYILCVNCLVACTQAMG